MNKNVKEINQVQKILSWKELSIDGMKEITEKDYRDFLVTHNFVIIDRIKIPLDKVHRIEKFEPEDFKLETTTVWSFPERGDWEHIAFNLKE